MKHDRYRRHSPKRERGAVLFVALIVLILLTLLGITAAQVTVLQERMSGSFRVQQLAFERAEGRMAAGRDTASNCVTSYDTISNAPVELGAGNVWPWSAWLANGPPDEYPVSGSSAPPTTLELGVHACGGACPQKQGSATGEDQCRKPRYYVITAQQKDLSTSDASTAAWSTIQTIYVY
ncbi:MAG TPA: PilX N-terminal domain-containing pilus assembly protein [Dokdonella sp.]